MPQAYCNDVNGNVIEEQHRQLDSATVTTNAQYILSDAGQHLMVLRDRDADNNTSSGNLGGSGSGLEERLWVEQGPDGSVWEIWKDGESSQSKESVVYSPDGEFYILWGATNGGGTVTIPDIRHSQYDWRYFWHDGRAESYPYSDSTGAIQRYDGLLWTGSGEYDTERGSPIGEDVYAYYSSGGEHSQWNYQQTIFANAGTSGFWSNPVTYENQRGRESFLRTKGAFRGCGGRRRRAEHL